MSAYDNEIYRGPPELGPTLAHDTPSYGTDFYLVKPPQTTAQQDTPPTEEAARQKSNSTEKKKSRVSKAMKLLASCTTTVLVATTLIAPLKPAHPVSQLPLWSRFGPVHGDGQYSFSAPAQSSDTCQVSIGGKSYCLIALQEGLYLQWHETYNASEDGSYGGFYVCMENPTEDWKMILDFNVNSLQKVESNEGLGQIQTDSGDMLYVRNFYIGRSKKLLSAQQILDNLSSYIQISDATYDGWDNVFIGDTMYSETNEQWNGIQTINPWHENGDFQFNRICSSGVAAYSTDNFICRHRVNGIDWSFYFSMDKGETMLWAVPGQEDIALGHNIDDLLSAYGIDPATLEEMSGSEVLADMPGELLTIIEVYTVGSGLQYYHLVEQPSMNVLAEPLPEWPQIATWNTSRDAQGSSIQVASENSHSCQVRIDDEVFQIESLQEDVYIFSERSRSYAVHVDTPDYYGSGAVIKDDYYQICDFDLVLQNTAEDWQVGLRISPYPMVDEDGKSYSPYGIIQTESGRTLYITNAGAGNSEPTAEEWQRLWTVTNDIYAYLRITETQDPDWGKVQLGDSLISDVNALWNGIRTVKHGIINPDSQSNFNWSLSQLRYTDSLNMQYYSHWEDREINGIQWSFYFSTGGRSMHFPDVQYNYSTCVLCAVPSVGEFCLEMHIGSLLTSFSGYADYWEALQDPMCYDEWIYNAIDMIVEDGLQYIYPLGELPSENVPADIPTNATEVPSTEATVDVPEVTTEATTEAAEALPRVETVVIYEYTDPDEKGTETTHYDQHDEVIKTEEHHYKNGALIRYTSETYQDGYTIIEEEYTYEENGNVISTHLNDKLNAVHSREQFEYDENGVLRGYELTYYASSSNAAPSVGTYYEEYDESGKLIDTDHTVYDPETDLWTFEDCESYVGVSFGESDKSWLVDQYADGIFTNSHQRLDSRLVEGVFYETFRETGNLWNYHQKNADGSAKHISYYTDGSLEQSGVITVDKATNTWIEITEYHPIPSDDFAYHHETRVRFYDDGRIAEYYYNSDGQITEIQFDENDQSKVEYDENGRMIKCYHTGDGFTTAIQFYYDDVGRLERVGSTTRFE